MRPLVAALAAVALAATPPAPPASAADVGHVGRFADDDGSVHEWSIESIAAAGITTGCAEAGFCPGGLVSGHQLHAFVLRALDVAVDTGDPSAPVTRVGVAAALDAALDLPAADARRFTDVDGHPAAAAVERLAAAGITAGCTPTTFCPDAPVRRDQLASLLLRASWWPEPAPPGPPGGQVATPAGPVEPWCAMDPRDLRFGFTLRWSDGHVESGGGTGSGAGTHVAVGDRGTTQRFTVAPDGTWWRCTPEPAAPAPFWPPPAPPPTN